MLKRMVPVVLVGLLAGSPSYARQMPSMASVDTSVNKEHPDLITLRQQMLRNLTLPPIDFWLAVARCETGHGINGKNQWTRGAHWPRAKTGGALGIHVDTWQGYGGQAYGVRPGKASMWAQIIVANRIGFLGFQTRKVFLTYADKVANRPFYRPAVGFRQGWGGQCRKNWVKNNG